MTFDDERMQIAQRIARHQAPVQVKVDPDAAKQQLVRLSVEKLLKAFVERASQLPPIAPNHYRVLASDMGLHDIPIPNLKLALKIDSGLIVLNPRSAKQKRAMFTAADRKMLRAMGISPR